MASHPLPVTHRAAYPQNFPGPPVTQGRRTPPTMKRRRPDRAGKGLRHFSMCVCNKVQEKGTTTYNEVADELVAEHRREVQESGGDVLDQGEPKNIRRRVYDALNVLMALNIISKDRKRIRWIGLPTNTVQEYKTYEVMRQKKQAQVDKLKRHLRDLVLQHLAFQNLIARNHGRMEAAEARSETLSGNRIQLPFIIVNTSQAAMIDCQMAEDRSEYFFDFNKPFTIHDDVEVLKQMGLTWGLEQGMITDEQHAEARHMIPSELIPVLDEMVAHYRANPAPMPGGHLATPILQPVAADAGHGVPVPTPMSAPGGAGLVPPALDPAQYPPQAAPFSMAAPFATAGVPPPSHMPSSTLSTSMPASSTS
eukprot:m.24475 g.24475  ORF g.24475 m.24475 type:complete len:365 (+) comp11515_c0_seq1:163-1257(+)